VDVFAPVLLGAEAETAWPETLLLDSTNFFITNTRTGQRSEAFNVFGLYGYLAGVSDWVGIDGTRTSQPEL
jgi:hypothetical protein